MIPDPEHFNRTWPFQARYCSAAGFRQHYINPALHQSSTSSIQHFINKGAGRPVILLHGQPT